MWIMPWKAGELLKKKKKKSESNEELERQPVSILYLKSKRVLMHEHCKSWTCLINLEMVAF